jgi:hypothetical protein
MKKRKRVLRPAPRLGDFLTSSNQGGIQQAIQMRDEYNHHVQRILSVLDLLLLKDLRAFIVSYLPFLCFLPEVKSHPFWYKSKSFLLNYCHIMSDFRELRLQDYYYWCITGLNSEDVFEPFIIESQTSSITLHGPFGDKPHQSVILSLKKNSVTQIPQVNVSRMGIAVDGHHWDYFYPSSPANNIWRNYDNVWHLDETKVTTKNLFQLMIWESQHLVDSTGERWIHVTISFL